MKGIVIALIILSQGIIIQAQCVHGTSTNPSNPVNNQIFGVRPELVNTFNWAEELSGIALESYDLQGMATLFNGQNGMINPYNQQNIYTHLVSAGVTKRDYHWEDGWEMLSFNLGYYPDGSSIASVPDGFNDPINQEIPYIIFYNRYRGVLRVFFNSLTGITNAYKGITIKLEFADKNFGLSGTFMPAQTILQGLDKKTNIKEVVSYSDHPNNSQLWAHADFQVGYDPCVCIFRSDIRVKFELVTSSTLTMTKREITVEQNLLNADGSVNYGKDFFANVNNNKTGLAVYKNLDLMVSNYQTELENVKRQNAAAKEHNQKLEFWKKLLGFATDGLPKVAKKITGLGTWGEDKISSITNGDTLISAATINKGIKEGLASGLDWLGGEFLSEKPYAANPTMPTAMFTEASYAGKIITSIETNAAKFYNPGSYSGASGHWSAGQSVDAFAYPYYNELMGVFALLETPQIDLTSSKKNQLTTLSHTGMPLPPPYPSFVVDYKRGNIEEYSCNYPGFSGPLYDNEFISLANIHSWYSSKKKLKLKKPLKYQFNPALDIKKYDIQAMWVVKIERDSISHLKKTKSSIESFFSQVSMTSLDLDGQGYYAGNVENGNPFSLTFNSAMVPLDKLYYFEPQLILNDHFSRVFNTGVDNYKENTYSNAPGSGLILPDYSCDAYPYIRANFLNSFTANDFDHIITLQDIANYTEEFAYKVTVQLKLIIDVTYNNIGSDGELTRQLFVQAYAIEDGDIAHINNSPTYNAQTVPLYNINTLPTDLTYNTTSFNGGTVNGCWRENNKYTCGAKRDISITGNINITAPYEVEFVAGRKIDVHPNTNVYGNKKVHLKIGDGLKGVPMPPASHAEVTDFCNGKGTKPYLANKPLARSIGFIDLEEEDELIAKDLKISLGIYPNPATNKSQHINVNYITNINATTKVYITDLYGRTLINVQPEKQVSSGVYKISVNISSLTPGIYLCTIIANNQRKTEKIVVMK